MKVLFREPINQPLQVIEIADEFRVIQKLVGGYFQAIDIGQGITCLLDEDGRSKGLGNNFFHDKYGWIIGNVIFLGTKGEDFISLTDAQIKYLVKYIGFPLKK